MKNNNNTSGGEKNEDKTRGSFYTEAAFSDFSSVGRSGLQDVILFLIIGRILIFVGFVLLLETRTDRGNRPVLAGGKAFRPRPTADDELKSWTGARLIMAWDG
jgi:hypothetical protein